VIVTCGSNGKSQQVCIFINSLDDSRKECKELDIILGVLAGVKEVLTVICGNRPVVVLARAVYACKGLLVEEAYKTVLQSDFLHDLHCKSVLIRCNV
jgi:hypothetical protein